MNKKKALSSVTAISLLLLFSVTATLFLSSWFSQYKSEVENMLTGNTIYDKFEITRLDENKLSVTNDFRDNLQINEIKINKVSCQNRNWIIDKGSSELNIGSCTEGLINGHVYEVAITTDYGVKNQNALARNIITNPFSVKFTFSACDFSNGYVRAYGLTDIDNAHVDIDNSGVYNACIKNYDFTLGTSSSGNFVNLLYLTDLNNSAVWTRKDIIYQSPSNWYNISLSSTSGTFDYQISSTDLSSSGYSCLGKIDTDDIYGSHMGTCTSTLPDTLWIKLN